MLFKSTLRLLLVETDAYQLVVPIVANSYKNTLWLLRHRESTARAVGIMEGTVSSLSQVPIGVVHKIDIYKYVLTLPNIMYTSIGKGTVLPDILSMTIPTIGAPIKDIEQFILRYSSAFSPDELLILLGVEHDMLFSTIGKLVRDKRVEYIAENGPNKWSFYDYYWLHEKYKLGNVRDLDIRPMINRSSVQIKFRAHSVGFTKKQQITKRLVTREEVTTDIVENNTVVLSNVERDYMVSQIHDILSQCVALDTNNKHKE